MAPTRESTTRRKAPVRDKGCSLRESRRQTTGIQKPKQGLRRSDRTGRKSARAGLTATDCLREFFSPNSDDSHDTASDDTAFDDPDPDDLDPGDPGFDDSDSEAAYRGEQDPRMKTRVTFLTTQILMRQMQMVT